MTAINSTQSISINGASAQEAAQIVAAVEQLAGTSSGQHIAEQLMRGSLSIELLDDETYAHRLTDSGAAHLGPGGSIHLPRSAVWQPHLVTLMAHEGQHTLAQAASGGRIVSAAGRLAGSTLDAVRGAMTLRNPITAYVDGFERRRQESEVEAYALQARVAQELGRDESSWGLGQGPGGTLLTHDEIRARVASSPLHALPEEARSTQSLTMAATMAGTIAPISYGLARMVAPKSQLGKHVMGHYVSAVVVTGVLLLLDSAHHTREAAGSGG